MASYTISITVNPTYINNLSEIRVYRGTTRVTSFDISALTDISTLTYEYTPLMETQQYRSLSYRVYPKTDFTFDTSTTYRFESEYNSTWSIVDFVNETTYIYSSAMDCNIRRTFRIGTENNPIMLGDIPTTKTVTFNYGLQEFISCTCDRANRSVLNVGDIITITANEGYYFRDIATFSNNTAFTMGEGTLPTVQTYTIKDSDPDTLTIGYDVYAYPITQDNPTLTYNLDQLVNCTINYASGSEIPFQTELIITCNDGYEFLTNNIAIYDSDNTPFYFTLSNNALILSILITNNMVGDITLTGYAEGVKITKSATGGFTYVYNPTEDEISALSQVVYLTVGSTVYNYSSYIVNFYRFPFRIPVDDLSTDDRYIKMGSMQQSTVSSKEFLTWTVRTELGKIVVPYKYNNVYDFKNTECNIYIPLYGLVNLPIEYVIGQTLTIYIDTEVYTGTGTLIIQSSLNNNTIYTTSKKLGVDIPYYRNVGYGDTLLSQGAMQTDTTKRAYLTVTRKEPYDLQGFYGKGQARYGKLTDETGFVRCSEVIFNQTINSLDYDIESEIISLLKSGVLINE